MDTTKDVTTPAILLAGGTALLLFLGFLQNGIDGASNVMAGVGLRLVIFGLLGIFGYFIASVVFRFPFGPVHITSLKIAAMVVTSIVVGTLMPFAFVTWIVTVVLYTGLLIWLFELESHEAIYSALIMWATQFFGGLFAMFILLFFAIEWG